MANRLRDFFIKKQTEVAPEARLPRVQPKQIRSFFNDKIEGMLNWDGRTIISANRDIQNESKQVRASARSLFQQVPYVTKYLTYLSNSILGPGGIALRANIKTREGNLHAVANKKVMDSWKDFGTAEHFCVDGRTTMLEACSQILKTTALDGEVFVRMVPGGKYGFQVQLLDADFLDETMAWINPTTQNQVVLGVEVDRWGKATAYHFRTSHPSDGGMGSKLIRIPANEVLHVYKVGQGATRMTANRGTSWLAPVFQHLKLLDEYMRYENAAALVASATLAFITQDKEAPVNVDDVTITPTGKAETAIVRNASLDPGSVQYLNAGEDVKRFESGHPSGNFADFVRAALRGVASGLNINYHILASDLENVNFSAGRLGLQEERDHFKCIQTWFIDVLLEPLFIAWSKTNATQSYTSVRNLDTLDWEWITRGWEYMQPVDEATANVMQLKNGLTSFSNIYQNRGLDYRMEFERLAEEKKFAAELGLQFADILPIAVPGAQEVEPAAEVKQEAKTPGAEDAEPVAEPTQAPSAAAKE